MPRVVSRAETRFKSSRKKFASSSRNTSALAFKPACSPAVPEYAPPTTNNMRR